ncbi:nicotinamide riboside transporter PnuC [Saccharibacter sp. 17.LH.SD]|uniref:nicotinamide riboside transporter PnuC n=1 Tax=Saccharibacter sp. 17.LH.SD TaxID=2689393 RepID=UPI00136C4B71|nr:nicotinamide riboside transporter PnuC [Saccharibacter sp. 17.LH.SD]MXV43611.1 nicotinamide riboside transporter PnuC [Saccharibacter sp. 17.LH.SD]
MPDLIETFSALISAYGVFLTARRSLLGWPISLIATLLYGWIFYRAHLYADTILQVIFGIGILYGWVLWHAESQRKASTSDFVKNLPPRPLYWPAAAIGALSTLFLTIGWSLILKYWSDDPIPLMDAALSSASLLAQFWTARRYRASWLLWSAIDLIYTGLFITRGLYPTAALYAGFIGIALYGYTAWRPRPH